MTKPFIIGSKQSSVPKSQFRKEMEKTHKLRKAGTVDLDNWNVPEVGKMIDIVNLPYNDFRAHLNGLLDLHDAWAYNFRNANSGELVVDAREKMQDIEEALLQIRDIGIIKKGKLKRDRRRKIVRATVGITGTLAGLAVLGAGAGYSIQKTRDSYEAATRQETLNSNYSAVENAVELNNFDQAESLLERFVESESFDPERETELRSKIKTEKTEFEEMKVRKKGHNQFWSSFMEATEARNYATARQLIDEWESTGLPKDSAIEAHRKRLSVEQANHYDADFRSALSEGKFNEAHSSLGMLRDTGIVGEKEIAKREIKLNSAVTSHFLSEINSAIEDGNYSEARDIAMKVRGQNEIIFDLLSRDGDILEKIRQSELRQYTDAFKDAIKEGAHSRASESLQAIVEKGLASGPEIKGFNEKLFSISEERAYERLLASEPDNFESLTNSYLKRFPEGKFRDEVSQALLVDGIEELMRRMNTRVEFDSVFAYLTSLNERLEDNDLDLNPRLAGDLMDNAKGYLDFLSSTEKDSLRDGSRVKVVHKDSKGIGFRDSYIKDRNNVFPIGTVGVVRSMGTDIMVKFPQSSMNADWRTSWEGINKESMAEYKLGELVPLPSVNVFQRDRFGSEINRLEQYLTVD